MAKTVGIDLGTTNSALAYIDEHDMPRLCPNVEGENTTPSVVALMPDHEAVVGEPATEYQASGLEPSIAFFKREMGNPHFVWSAHGRDYDATDLSAMVLTKLLDDVQAELGVRPEEAIVTVPAYFRDPERLATKEAAEKAGLRLLQTVNEPTAAAIAYGARSNAVQGKVLVFDLGGGTFDVSVVEFGAESKVLSSAGDHHLGGKDWDETIVREIADLFADEHGVDPYDDPAAIGQLWRQAEQAKKALSRKATFRMSVSACGETSVFEMTRDRFADLTEPLVQQTLSLTDAMLEEMSLRAEDVTEVLLVGGSTRMPMIQTMLERRFGRPPRTHVNPDEAVALGAAILTGQVPSSRAPTAKPARRAGGVTAAPKIADVTGHSLGMIAVNDDRSAYLNTIILPKDSPVPGRQHRPYRHLFRSAEDELEIFVTQGELTDVETPAYLGRYVLKAPPGVPLSTPVEIEIDYAYDESGIVHVSARQAGKAQWSAVERHPVPDDVPERFREMPEPEIVREPLTIYIFIDVSGSMSGAPIEDAKRAGRDFVAQMDLSLAAIGIGIVADRTVILQEATQNARDLNRAIDRIACNADGAGYGNMAHPFDDLGRLLLGREGIRAGIVLADGVWAYQDKAISTAQTCHREGIEVVGIGFGSADRAFLDAISSAKDLSLFTSQEGLSAAFTSVAQVLSRKSGISIAPGRG